MPPVIDHLIDNKLLAASAQKRKEQELTEQVQRLQEKLEEVTIIGDRLYNLDNIEAAVSLEENDSNSDDDNSQDQVTEINSDSASDEPANSNYDVILRVKPQKMQQITSQIIDGKKCIVIPMEEDEHANVNGVTNLL